MSTKCDATFTETTSHCSNNIIEVWHGMADPAYGCGKHVGSEPQAVFNGHRVRNAK